jgi:serine phosphatase RsbU (regulator of sigma subunit)
VGTADVLLARKPRSIRAEFAWLQDLVGGGAQQLDMMPGEILPSAADHAIEIHAVMRPAQEVGGDFYDAFEAAPGILCLAVGDVSGKGVAAALFMARTRSLLRTATLESVAVAGRVPAASEVLGVLNAELCKDNSDCMFVTLFVGFFDLASGRLGFANAGHVRPYRLRAGAGTSGRSGGRSRVERLDSVPDLPLGLVPEAGFSDATIDLAPGDALVVLTDGLPETINGAGAFYSLARIVADLDELADAPPRALATALIERVHRFAGSGPQADDITVLAMRRPMPAERRNRWAEMAVRDLPFA